MRLLSASPSQEVVAVAAEDVLDVGVDVPQRAGPPVVGDVVERDRHRGGVGVVLVGHLVGARPAADVVGVRAVAGEEPVAAGTAVDLVGAVVAADPDLVACAAEQDVVLVAGVDLVVAVAALDPCRGPERDEVVGLVAAEEHPLGDRRRDRALHLAEPVVPRAAGARRSMTVGSVRRRATPRSATIHSSGANDRPALTLFASPAPAVNVIVPPDRVTVAADRGRREDEEGGEGDEQSHQQAFGFFVPGARQSVLDLGPFPSRIV